MKLVNYIGMSFGADPELFLARDGEIIGSEKVIPEAGILVPGSTWRGVIRDGVQVEFNVAPNSCRQSFSTNLAGCFRALDSELQQSTLKKLLGSSVVKPVFDQSVKVKESEMKTLHPSSQQFGCAPSLNAYGNSPISIVDASRYFYRSAGGHLHLGVPVKDAPRTVMMLDILLGNTCVLLDRDVGNIERRKVYGRAGEYRLPRHGLEYRVLSNFWLRSYQLTSFVLAMARFAVSVSWDAEASEEILKLVDLEQIRYAIDNNDYDVAMKNFKAIKEYVKNIVGYHPNDRDYIPEMDASWPLEARRMDAFEVFADKGMDYWFKDDPYKHWLGHNFHHRHGWESFIDLDVIPKEVVKITTEKVNIPLSYHVS